MIKYYMKNKGIIYCLAWFCLSWLTTISVSADVLEGLPIEPISDPNLRVEPSFLEFDCIDPNTDSGGAASSSVGWAYGPRAQPENQEPETSTVTDPMNKLILPEEIINRLNRKQAKARVIVNLHRLGGTAKRVRELAGGTSAQRQGGSHRVFEVDGNNRDLAGAADSEERRAWREIRREIAVCHSSFSPRGPVATSQ